MINTPPHFTGLNIKIPSKILLRGEGLLIRGLGYRVNMGIHASFGKGRSAAQGLQCSAA